MKCLLLALIAALVLFLLKNYRNLRIEKLLQTIADLTGGVAEEAEVLSFAPDAGNTFDSYLEGLAVFCPTGLTIIGPTGNELQSLQYNVSHPAMKSAGDYLLTYDIGGKNVLYMQDGSVLKNEAYSSLIFTADLNSSGWHLIASEESGSKATASVFNGEMAKVYQWESRERYVSAAALSEDNERMAFGGFRQDQARIVSSVLLLRFDSEEPYGVYDIPDVLILDMRFLSDGSLAVLTENSVLILDKDGMERGRYEYGGRQLKNYSFDGEGFLMVRLSKSGIGESSQVLLLDYNAAVLGEIALNNILSADCNGKHAGVLTTDRLIVYNSSMEEQFTSPVTAGSKRILMREDGAALVLSSTEATIYR